MGADPAVPGQGPLSLSVVVPVLDGRHYLERSLPALLALRDPAPLEVILVDDGSGDGSPELARELGALVLSSGGRARGPGRARNVGIEAARGDVVLFVDADVVVHADVASRLVAAFEDPGTTAVFGSYDDAPPHRGFASQYMNLRHHHVHSTPADDAPTFWAGLGAVRRRALLAVGGYDAVAFSRPSVEDIELGRRLRAVGGRIRRLPAIQGTHLKRWSLAEVLRTDVLQRALPWAEMMLRHPGSFDDLNVSTAERERAALALLFLGVLAAALARLLPWWLPLPLLAAAGLVNARLVGLFVRRNGPLFALGALLYHQLYYAYSSAAYAWTFVRLRLSRGEAAA
jgi:glycosyltransferase involved in cell wall biosynthesis